MTQDIDVGKLTEQINDKADRDLWNTVPNVWNNTLNTSQITNCITEIPQDIKLELNNGTLTLKAGSKVYVPNGFEADGTTPKFDYVGITSDRTVGISSGNTSLKYVYVIQDSVHSRYFNTTQCFSGATAPTGGNYLLWYDTTNNLIKESQDGGATWTGRKASFPICLFLVNGNQITSIDQVFNGFGYIGSTIFALPGVKGLIPNGRNTDGSLKNIEFINSSVRTYTYTNPFDNWPVIFGPDRLYALSQFKIEDNPSRIPTSGQWFSYYSPKDNRIYQSDNGGDWFIAPGYIIGNETISSGRITSFTPKTAFHAVDYNDYARELNSKQDIANLSQTIDDSTSKYPSNKAVKTAIDAKDSLPSQTGNSGKFLTTDGTTTSWGTVDVSGAINTHNTDLNAHSNKFQVVSALPSSPIEGVFYFVKE